MWNQFESHVDKIFKSKSVFALLEWDQRTYLPAGSAAQRAEQLAYMQTQVHELITAPQFLEILTKLENDSSLSETQKAAVRQEMRRSRLKSRVPADLVSRISTAQSQGFEAWKLARTKNDFKFFQKELETIVALKKELGEYLKEPGGTAYEGLVGEFEPEFPLPKIEALLSALCKELAPLIAKIREKQASSPFERRSLSMPVPLQAELCQKALDWMGFNFQQGRLDQTVHPFCGGAGTDVRLTTKYIEADWRRSFFPAIHEGGHGLYAQGFEKFASHRSLKEATGFGMDESQSRFWENSIARSRPFLSFLLKELSSDPKFKSTVSGLDAETLYRQVNQVEPSYIRVEADEATYNLHIMIRFEIESALFRGDLQVKDLPAVWNEKIQSYLGLRAPDDLNGILQDVHWSMGAFGYFPSYTLGNMIAAQFNETIRSKLDIDSLVSKNELPKIRDWLHQNIHAHGSRYDTLELVRRTTGSELSHRSFITYLEKKFL